MSLIFVMLIGCNLPKPQNNGKNNKAEKQKLVLKFKYEIGRLCDSCNSNFDWAIASIEKGESSHKISTQLTQKLSKFENKINFLLEEFRHDAYVLGVQNWEYEKAIDYMFIRISPLNKKDEKLTKLGIQTGW